LSLWGAKVLAAFAPVARETYAFARTARAACARPNARRGVSRQLWLCQLDSLSNAFQSASKFHQRTKSVIMPLIELAPRGKDVSLSLTLPEETANDVKLYARFLKASHQAAVSNIISECIRRTLKQDTEFQTWKADPANIKTNRGGARQKKAGSPAPPQSNKP
jgi:hypothetical protein